MPTFGTSSSKSSGEAVAVAARWFFFFLITFAKSVVSAPLRTVRLFTDMRWFFMGVFGCQRSS